MAEARAQRARRVLVSVVSSYDSSVVRKTAIDFSEEFVEFIDKPLLSGELDAIDVIEIANELEDMLDVSIPDANFATWRDFFEYIVKELNQE
jgi:acyl carrier protein